MLLNLPLLASWTLGDGLQAVAAGISLELLQKETIGFETRS